LSADAPNNTGRQGQQNVNVTLTGQFTHFVQGTTTASFGAGITVVTLTVNSATGAAAVVNIDPAAATGSRDVTMTTAGEVVTTPVGKGFTVAAGTPLLSADAPNSTGRQGPEHVKVTLSGQWTRCVQGTTSLRDAVPISVVTLTVNSATGAAAVVNIDPAAATGSRDVTMTTAGEVVTTPVGKGFTVAAGTPLLSADAPNRSEERRVGKVNVTWTGQFTHFVQGTTTARCAAGITVVTLTVNSATAATAVVNIDPAAATGSRDVTMTTAGEVVTTPVGKGFTVAAGTPLLSADAPN